MKKHFSKIAFIFIMIFACTALTACSPEDIAAQSGTTVIQQAVNINELYELFVEENPDATLNDFLKSLNVTYSDTEYAVSKSIYSAVSIFSTFTQRTTSRPWGGQTVESDYSAAGSGIIYSNNGTDVYIITNYHVIYDRDSITDNSIAKSITVYSYGHENSGDAVTATFVGGNMNNDIAVLRANTDDFAGKITAAEIADSDEIALGDTAVVIGNPLAEGLAVTAGIISVLSEEIEMEALDSAARSIKMQVIRTDAAINSGNSGGGLFNGSGELIGIINAKTVQSGVENMGYAIPANTVKAIVSNALSA